MTAGNAVELLTMTTSKTTQTTVTQPKKISPPTTTHDDASPSDSCFTDMERTFRLMEDERHLSALALYRSVLERIDNNNNNNKEDNASQVSSTKSSSRRLNLRNRYHKPKESNKEDLENARQLIVQNQQTLKKLEVCTVLRRRKRMDGLMWQCSTIWYH
jgi:hypothetical protein